MKQLRWTTNVEQADYMRGRVAENLARSARNQNEQWAANRLSETPYRWKPQAQWGYRIFDFWCQFLGVAVEIDGPDHDPEYDAYRDEYNFRRSGIVVLRVRNKNEQDMDDAIAMLDRIEGWTARRLDMGLSADTKEERRANVNLPDDRKLLMEYLTARQTY